MKIHAHQWVGLVIDEDLVTHPVTGGWDTTLVIQSLHVTLGSSREMSCLCLLHPPFSINELTIKVNSSHSQVKLLKLHSRVYNSFIYHDGAKLFNLII